MRARHRDALEEEASFRVWWEHEHDDAGRRQHVAGALEAVRRDGADLTRARCPHQLHDLIASLAPEQRAFAYHAVDLLAWALACADADGEGGASWEDCAAYLAAQQDRATPDAEPLLACPVCEPDAAGVGDHPLVARIAALGLAEWATLMALAYGEVVSEETRPLYEQLAWVEDPSLVPARWRERYEEARRRARDTLGQAERHLKAPTARTPTA